MYTPENVKTIPTRSASWHWAEAEKYMSLASMMQAEPDHRGARAANTYDQTLWATLALAHAELAKAGATILAACSHSPERQSLVDHAAGHGTREVK